MKQRGFSLIMGIFLIVVLGGIAVFIGRVSTMQHQSSALDEEGAMAYQAARAGIEWGIYRAIIASSCIAGPSVFTLVLTVPTTPVSAVNYAVSVICIRTQVTEGSTANNVNVYQITSTANNASVGDFAVERRLTATVSQ
ncbi:hypothetical protein [Methylobacter sp.]|uniref:hypothetical protein n=1 Tax=Methylobacter sp. TaxID=2051955 RepID=UPI002FDDD605